MPIRLSKEKDLKRMTEIYNQAIVKGGCTADTTPFTIEERKAWFNAHQTEKYPLYVLEVEGKVAGYFYFTAYRPGRKAMDKVAEISYYLDEQYHGKGYGSEMMIAALEKGKEIGFDTLLAILLSFNKASIALLEKYGFSEWGRLPEIAVFDTYTCDHLYYGKQIKG